MERETIQRLVTQASIVLSFRDMSNSNPRKPWIVWAMCSLSPTIFIPLICPSIEDVTETLVWIASFQARWAGMVVLETFCDINQQTAVKG